MPNYRVTIVKQVEWIYDVEYADEETAVWHAEEENEGDERPPDKQRWLSTDCFELVTE